MNDLDELRALVREVIRDVLPDGLANGLPVTETVDLSTDEDLAAFVTRLLDLDAGEREDLRAGRKRFRLASATAGISSAFPAPALPDPQSLPAQPPAPQAPYYDGAAVQHPPASGGAPVQHPPAPGGAPVHPALAPGGAAVHQALAPGGAPVHQPPAPGGVPVRRVESGAVTEALVRDAARAGERLVLGRAAVLTPLARDRARASGVEIVKER